ncbi:MAG: tyrosine-type recombinase/integrase [Ktedonobacteraceae bacterium]
MSTEQVSKSEEKVQRLKEHLTDQWAEDLWILGPKNNPKKQRRIRISFASSTLSVEMKYALWRKFASGQWHQERNTRALGTRVLAVIRWLNTFTPPIQSLMEKSLDHWELSLRSYLVQTGHYKRREEKALLATQQYVVYQREDRSVSLFRQLYALVAESYDDRPETEKDIWDMHKLGLAINPTTTGVLLNFTRISQPWLRRFAKQCMHYAVAVRSPGSCIALLLSLVRFSRFLSQHYPMSSLASMDRPLIVHYLSVLREAKNLSISSRNDALVHLRSFFETCAYQLQIEDFPKERLIFNEDLAKEPKTAPRDIPEEVLAQLREHLGSLPTVILRMVTILLEVGMRLSELLTLPLDRLIHDDRNEWYVRFYLWKLQKEQVLPPVNEEVIGTIQAQQQDMRSQWGNACPYLFPSPQSHVRPYKQETFRRLLNVWAVKEKIQDGNGQLYRFTAHQFRHTVAMRLINDDIPLEVISRLLGHQSLEMTQRYARVKNKKLRADLMRVQLKRKTVNSQGNVIKGDPRANDPEVQMTRKGMRGQTLPIGGCGRLVVLGECAHANKCLTCPMWLTSTEDLPELKSFYERAVRLKQRAIEKDNQFVVEHQDRILAGLSIRISSLERSEMDGTLVVDEVLGQLQTDLAEAENALEEVRENGLIPTAKYLERTITDLKARIAALEEPA